MLALWMAKKNWWKDINVEDILPLEPMIDTLRKYCEDKPYDAFNKDVCLNKIKSPDNIYYDIF